MTAAASAKNIRFLARSDQGGKPDGVQVILHKGHAFVGHMFSDGYSVIDVRDPRQPKTVAFVAAPKNTRSHHLQIHGDILLAVNGPNIWAMQQYATQQDYYAKSLIDSVQTEQPFAAGLRVFDVSSPAPRANWLFWTYRVSAPIEHGGLATAMRTCPCISKDSSTMLWRWWISQIPQSQSWLDTGGYPA